MVTETDMNIDSFIADRLAAPQNFAVVVTYAGGFSRTLTTETAGQAENYAHGQRAKIGRDLIDRDTGKTVRVVSVTISEI